jgi:hypothetical protein
MERNLSWNDAWEKINQALEGLDDEDKMLPMLESHISYILECYYKKEGHAALLIGMVETVRSVLDESDGDDGDICDECRDKELADKADSESEQERREELINDQVRRVLRLEPMLYTCPPKDDADDCYPEPGNIHRMHMWISIPEFEVKDNIYSALGKTAIVGPCDFRWPVGIWDRMEYKKASLNNPTWAELFKLANRAFLDGYSVDHHFLEGFDERAGVYEFFFGS